MIKIQIVAADSVDKVTELLNQWKFDYQLKQDFTCCVWSCFNIMPQAYQIYFSNICIESGPVSSLF